MPDNLSMKRALIIQSFAPLFVIQFIKYFDEKLFYLVPKFFSLVTSDFFLSFEKMWNHPLFITMILEIICLLLIVYSIITFFYFSSSQKNGYESKGESLISIEKVQDTGATFFMTYVLPMAMDDLNKWRGLVVFFFLMLILYLLMSKTNLYYQTPVLTILGYEVFSFKFESTQLSDYKDRVCIGISRGKISVGKSIKRKKISDNVFFIYENVI